MPDAVRTKRETGAPLHPVLKLLLVAGFLMPLGVGMCAIAVIPNFDFPRRDRARLDLGNLEHAAKVFEAKHGRALNRLSELIEEGILERVPMDPWDVPYGYRDVCGQPVFFTLGADRAWGGADKAADLVSQGFVVGPENFIGDEFDLGNLGCAAARFLAREGRLPFGTEELVRSGDLSGETSDAWERPYRYWIVRGDPVFVSLGRDGTCGGEGEDADIASRGFLVHREECEARDR